MQQSFFTMVKVGIVDGQPIWITSDFPGWEDTHFDELSIECFEGNLNVIKNGNGDIVGFNIVGIIPKQEAE